jgi:hypothetical protein
LENLPLPLFAKEGIKSIEGCVLTAKRLYHSSLTKKLVVLSIPIVVSGPWPEKTLVSSGNSSSILKDFLSFSILPPGKSVLPTEP